MSLRLNALRLSAWTDRTETKKIGAKKLRNG